MEPNELLKKRYGEIIKISTETRRELLSLEKQGQLDSLNKGDYKQTQAGFQLMSDIEGVLRNNLKTFEKNSSGENEIIDSVADYVDKLRKKRELRRKIISSTLNIAVFMLVVVIIVSVYMFRGDMRATAPPMILGHSALIVMSGSMESAYPRDSLIVIRQVNPDNLNVGDDITYLTATNMVITHRIVEVIESYGLGGERGFRTQGIENRQPDTEIVFAPNVIGRVIYGNVFLGNVVVFLRNNIIFVGFFLIVTFVLSHTLKQFVMASRDERVGLHSESKRRRIIKKREKKSK
jgi:signal peptidase I